MQIMFSWKLKGHDFSTTGDLKGQGGDGRRQSAETEVQDGQLPLMFSLGIFFSVSYSYSNFKSKSNACMFAIAVDVSM
jgi:hypothetical protein